MATNKWLNLFQSQLSVTCLIFHKKCAINAEIYNYSVQPLIKRESKLMNQKALFPVLEMGFLFWRS